MFGCSARVKGRASLAGVVGIQEFSHTLASYHKYILYLILNSINFRTVEILVHTYDGLFTETIRKSEHILAVILV